MLLIFCVYYHIQVLILVLNLYTPADVDFTNSGGGDIDMDVNALDASQHLEGTAMEVEDPLVDTTAVEACNNINTADITSPTTTNEAGVDTTTLARKRKLDITNLEKNEEKKKEKKQQKHEDASPVSSNIRQANRDDDGK